MDKTLSWQHMSHLKLNFVKMQRCSDIFQCLKYFHENKERSEKSLILVFFKCKQHNNYVSSLSPVFTENGQYAYDINCSEALLLSYIFVHIVKKPY